MNRCIYISFFWTNLTHFLGGDIYKVSINQIFVSNIYIQSEIYIFRLHIQLIRGVIRINPINK